MSFPFVGNLSLKKDAGQAGMKKNKRQRSEITFKFFEDL
jgi:hypothetical protein